MMKTISFLVLAVCLAACNPSPAPVTVVPQTPLHLRLSCIPLSLYATAGASCYPATDNAHTELCSFSGLGTVGFDLYPLVPAAAATIDLTWWTFYSSADTVGWRYVVLADGLQIFEYIDSMPRLYVTYYGVHLGKVSIPPGTKSLRFYFSTTTSNTSVSVSWPNGDTSLDITLE